MVSPTLTPELIEAILAKLRVGVSYRTACAANGVPAKFAETWWRWGEDGVEPYASLVSGVEAKIAKVEIHTATKLCEAIDSGDVQSARFFLERRFPRDWQPKQGVEVTGAGGGPMKFDAAGIESILRQLRGEPSGAAETDTAPATASATDDKPDPGE